MPALITHDFFARDVYDRLFSFIGGSRDEAEAFLLGSQGPDPLFFTVISPRYSKYSDLGHRMHSEDPSELLAALKNSLSVLDKNETSVGRAYALGFLCHYSLDVTMHPFVFAQQYQLCDAGSPNLTRKDGSDVHGVIETELDELVLFAKRQITIAKFNPSKEVLRASDFTLDVISKMYAYCALTVYDEVIPSDLFEKAVKDYRIVQTVLYSPTGAKRLLGGKIERLVKTNSRFQSLSHRAVELTDSPFANHNHNSWINPFTNESSTKSFWDLYAQGLEKAYENISLFEQPSFNLEAAQQMTNNLNFSGSPTTAELLSVESCDEDDESVSFKAKGEPC